MTHTVVRTLLALPMTIACLALSAGAGTVCGTIVFEGKPPKMALVPVDGDPKCAALHKEPLTTDWLVLGEGQTVGNVFVEVAEGLPEAEHPVPETPFVLSQEGCMYAPHVIAVRAGQTIEILNPNETAHNIHFLPKVNSEYNKSMPETRKSMTYVLEKAEDIFPIKCDVHLWMQAYCVVLEHPFFDVTERDGAYSISGLPAGKYTLRFWHEKLGEQRHEVTVPAEGEVVLDLTLTRPKAE